jgi:glucosylceramidase
MSLSQIRITAVIFVALLAACESGRRDAHDPVIAEGATMWVTSGDRSALLQRIDGRVKNGIEESVPVIKVDTAKTYQVMDGFGFSLTGGSAWLLMEKLSPEKRSEILRELFTTDGTGAGVSYLRISIGASDLDPYVFSYADHSAGTKAKDISGFTLKEDNKFLIPALKEILAFNPHIKIMGSPWSPPAWMKTNNHLKAGSLKKEYYSEYAKYFVQYVKGMAEEGITIDAVTVQNEPENPNNTPSLVMTAGEQTDFVKNHLGPAFQQANIKTKIVVFDHNCDHPEYPIAILNDAEAKKYVDGSAFHLYLGEIQALSKVHEAHPDRSVYFTEQWTSGEGKFHEDLFWHTRELIIGAPRNWSKNVLEWNLAADAKFDPHTDDGGCTICQGALTIDSNAVKKNVSYYIIAQASKFVPAGSVRIDSNISIDLPNIAYQTPEGKKVLITLNESSEDRKFAFTDGKNNFTAQVPKGSVATITW